MAAEAARTAYATEAAHLRAEATKVEAAKAEAEAQMEALGYQHAAALAAVERAAQAAKSEAAETMALAERAGQEVCPDKNEVARPAGGGRQGNDGGYWLALFDEHDPLSLCFFSQPTY